MERHLRDGEPLFEAGDRNSDFFVVLAGAVEILDWTGDPPQMLAVHQPGEFIAEIGRANPDSIRGYRALGDAGKAVDLLGAKTRLNLRPVSSLRLAQSSWRALGLRQSIA